MITKFASLNSCVLMLCGALLSSAQNQPEQRKTPIHPAMQFQRMVDKGALGSETKKSARTFSGQIHKPMGPQDPGMVGSPQRPDVKIPVGSGQRTTSEVTLHSIRKADFAFFDNKSAAGLHLTPMAETPHNQPGDPRAYITSPGDGATLAPSQNFIWSNGSGARDYSLWVGSCYDCTDIVDEDEGLNLQRTLTLPDDGRIIYVTLFTLVGNDWYWVDYEFVASKPVVPAALTNPGNGWTVANPQTFDWSLGTNVMDTWMTIGSCFECGDILYEDEGLASSRTVKLPANGITLFATLYSLGNDGYWYWYDYQFRASNSAAVPVQVNITNDYLYSMNIFVNGTLVGSVDPSKTQYVDTRVNPLAVSFQLVQPTLNGKALGDPVSGYWDMINNPSGTYNLEAGYKLGATYYFLPQITNDTGVNLEIEVNGGYNAENRCSCYAPAYTQNVRAGYYELYGNSNVRLYINGDNYTGAYLYFGTEPNGNVSPSGPLYNLVEVPSGLLSLTATSIP